jgi:hypothetical protein
MRRTRLPAIGTRLELALIKFKLVCACSLLVLVIVPSIACPLLTNATDTRFPGNVSFGQQLWLGCHRSFVRYSLAIGAVKKIK